MEYMKVKVYTHLAESAKLLIMLPKLEESYKCKLLSRIKMCTFVLFCLHIIFFLFSIVLQKLQKTVMSPYVK